MLMQLCVYYKQLVFIYFSIYMCTICCDMVFSFPDPHIKVVGLPTDIKKARQMILSVLDSKVRFVIINA